MKVDLLTAQKLTHKSGEGALQSHPHKKWEDAAKPQNTGSLNRITSTRP